MRIPRSLKDQCASIIVNSSLYAKSIGANSPLPTDLQNELSALKENQENKLMQFEDIKQNEVTPHPPIRRFFHV